MAMNVVVVGVLVLVDELGVLAVHMQLLDVPFSYVQMWQPLQIRLQMRLQLWQPLHDLTCFLQLWHRQVKLTLQRLQD